MSDNLPPLDARHLQVPDLIQLEPKWPSSHPPRILLVYGSLLTRDRSHYLTSR
jgi:arsenic resistance protein ArsH